MFDPVNGADGLEAWVARELRRPVATDPVRKARIMELVRSAGPPSRRGRRPRPGRGARAGWASPVVGFALAAGVCGVMTLRGLRPAHLLSLEPHTGDASVVAASVLGDTVVATIRDTVRLVRFMLVAPGASRVALAGDFNRWDARATPLIAAESGGVWRVAVALAPGRHRYAFVIDDTQWVADPAAPRADADSGRPHSILTVVPRPN